MPPGCFLYKLTGNYYLLAVKKYAIKQIIKSVFYPKPLFNENFMFSHFITPIS